MLTYHVPFIAHQAAFKIGILHRDISAANILITTNPRFNGGLLIDWDLCKETDGNPAARQITRTVRTYDSFCG
jgi:RIO-like serine/threonine protein kinase